MNLSDISGPINVFIDEDTTIYVNENFTLKDEIKHSLADDFIYPFSFALKDPCDELFSEFICTTRGWISIGELDTPSLSGYRKGNAEDIKKLSDTFTSNALTGDYLVSRVTGKAYLISGASDRTVEGVIVFKFMDKDNVPGEISIPVDQIRLYERYLPDEDQFYRHGIYTTPVIWTFEAGMFREAYTNCTIEDVVTLPDYKDKPFDIILVVENKTKAFKLAALNERVLGENLDLKPITMTYGASITDTDNELGEYNIIPDSRLTRGMFFITDGDRVYGYNGGHGKLRVAVTGTDESVLGFTTEDPEGNSVHIESIAFATLNEAIAYLRINL